MKLYSGFNKKLEIIYLQQKLIQLIIKILENNFFKDLVNMNTKKMLINFISKFL